MKIRKFIESELKLLHKTMTTIKEAIMRETGLGELEVAGMGKYLSDMYMGYEHILRTLLEEMGIKISKGERWHTDLLQNSIAEGIVPAEWEDILRKMLNFRHFQIHGYGRFTNEEKIRQGAVEIIEFHPTFEKHIREILEKC